MSGRVGHRKRLISVTAANVRNSHLYLTGHTDFFPKDAIGSANEKDGKGKLIRLDVDGLPEPVWTDIASRSATAESRGFFRKRGWVREFFARHNIQPGDTIAFERIDSHRFKVQPFEAKPQRESPLSLVEIKSARSDQPTVIELFAGCGGMALGFKRAGFSTILANEWDKDACETLRANVSPNVLNCAIQEVTDFPKADVVAGGPPCQGFSNLGERVPNDPRNQLWRHYFRCVAQAEPKIFVLENVPPLLKSAEFQEMKRVAEELGYAVEGRVLNAADYGVPQTRKRAIVIGSRIGDPSFPVPEFADPAKAGVFTTVLPAWKTVRQAIGHLPLEPTEKNWHIGRNPTAMSLERYKCIPPGGNRWDLPLHLTPDCWKRKTQGGTDLFGRLWWDRPSVTIRTEFYKPEKGRYLHPVAHRPITHLEASLLQSFPEDFDYKGSRISVGIQIGNAVPPTLAEAIAKHVMSVIKSSSRQLRRSAV